MNAPDRRSRKRASGYTLVEVMLAVSVMTVGALGFTAMQGASSRAVRSAQEATLAVAFQETWVERVRRDALRWTALGTTGLANTWYLSKGVGKWFAPTSQLAGESAAADFAGRDTTVKTDMRYCVNLRNTVAHVWNPATRPIVDPTTDIDAMRVDVLVWWYQATAGLGGTLTVNMASVGCTDLTVADFTTDRRLSKSVTSTVVRWRQP